MSLPRQFGPNILYVQELEYAVDPDHGEAFHAEMSRYLPFVAAADLSPDMAGIRPMLQANGFPYVDFVIQNEAARGIPGLVDLIGIESPGLTCCLSIAETVDKMIR